MSEGEQPPRTGSPTPITMQYLLEKQKLLMSHIPHGHVIKEEHQPRVVAGMGIIEEVLEYLNAIGFKSWRPDPLTLDDQLEELTDILFFYLELVLLSGFSWGHVVRRYDRKWEENMERYRRAKEGDYGWDKRAEKKSL